MTKEYFLIDRKGNHAHTVSPKHPNYNNLVCLSEVYSVGTAYGSTLTGLKFTPKGGFARLGGMERLRVVDEHGTAMTAQEFLDEISDRELVYPFEPNRERAGWLFAEATKKMARAKKVLAA